MAQLGLVEIPERLMHDAAIVPREDIVLLPLVAVHEFRTRGVAHEIIDQRLAFLFSHPVEALHLLAYVQRFSGGFGMHPYYGLRDRRVEAPLLLGAREARIVVRQPAG